MPSIWWEADVIAKNWLQKNYFLVGSSFLLFIPIWLGFILLGIGKKWGEVLRKAVVIIPSNPSKLPKPWGVDELWTLSSTCLEVTLPKIMAYGGSDKGLKNLQHTPTAMISERDENKSVWTKRVSAHIYLYANPSLHDLTLCLLHIPSNPAKSIPIFPPRCH